MSVTRRTGAVAASLLCLAALVFWASRPAVPSVRSAEARMGEFVDALQIRGEIKASRSITLTAPAEAGDLRILRLASGGTAVKKGDVIVEFDGSTVTRTLEEKGTELRGYEAEIEKVRAQSRTTEQAGVTAATKADYDVQRGTLDYSARDILSRVEGEQRRLAVLDFGQKLLEANANLTSTRAAGRADLAATGQKRERAGLELEKARRQLAALKLTAPTDGVLSLLPNYRASNWNNLQDFKEGDRAWPGAAIAELPDASSLYVSARVDEVERGRLKLGHQATARVEAVPDRELPARIESISALAKTDFSSWPPPRNFDLRVKLEGTDPRLRPGMSATLRVAVERVPNVLLVPVEAMFNSAGQDVVYVLGRNSVERRPVVVERRNGDHAVIKEGLRPGERVAVEDPTTASGEAQP
jgi:HlyD family secretion protein